MKVSILALIACLGLPAFGGVRSLRPPSAMASSALGVSARPKGKRHKPHKAKKHANPHKKARR